MRRRVVAVAQADAEISDGGARRWRLRYTLYRLNVGSASTFAIVLHAQQRIHGLAAGEQTQLAGTPSRDEMRVRGLFRRLVAARVLPLHLRDAVRDATVDWRPEAAGPLEVELTAPPED